MIDRTPSLFVRRALLADAVVSGVTGALLTLGASLAAPVLGLPQGLLLGVGLFCVGYGGALGWLARTPALSATAVRTVVIGNTVWVAASVLFMLVGPSTMTALGLGFVGFQAAVVAGLAEVQWMGLRRQRLVQAAA
jgi:hypothetical protein